MKKSLLSVKLDLYRCLARTQTRCLATLFNTAVDGETKEREPFTPYQGFKAKRVVQCGPWPIPAKRIVQIGRAHV